jgi:hypothetical protein
MRVDLAISEVQLTMCHPSLQRGSRALTFEQKRFDIAGLTDVLSGRIVAASADGQVLPNFSMSWEVRMLRKSILVFAVCCVFAGAQSAGVRLVACASQTCSLQWDWCAETAEYFYGQYLECCTGFSVGPRPGQCNNDSNQCYCVDEPRN